MGKPMLVLAIIFTLMVLCVCEPMRPANYIVYYDLYKSLKDTPSNIHEFKKKVYPAVSKATFLAYRDDNIGKIQDAVKELNAGKSVSALDKDYLFDSDKSPEEQSKFKRVIYSALAYQNDEILAQRPKLFDEIQTILENTVVYHDAEEASADGENIPRPMLKDSLSAEILIVQNDLTSEAIKQFRTGGGRIGFVLAADATKVGGNHIDGVKGTIEESAIYSAPHFSPLLAVVAFTGGYPIPEYGAIYVPEVTIFRDNEMNLLQGDEVRADFLFSVAYDLRQKGQDHHLLNEMPRYFSGLAKKIGTQFAAAAAHGVDTILIGAFGCGVFENQPAHVIDAYKAAMEDYKDHFKRIVFVIMDGPSETRVGFKGNAVENINRAWYNLIGGLQFKKKEKHYEVSFQKQVSIKNEMSIKNGSPEKKRRSKKYEKPGKLELAQQRNKGATRDIDNVKLNEDGHLEINVLYGESKLVMSMRLPKDANFDMKTGDVLDDRCILYIPFYENYA